MLLLLAVALPDCFFDELSLDALFCRFERRLVPVLLSLMRELVRIRGDGVELVVFVDSTVVVTGVGTRPLGVTDAEEEEGGRLELDERGGEEDTEGCFSAV